jgi:hypothetical protein
MAVASCSRGRLALVEFTASSTAELSYMLGTQKKGWRNASRSDDLRDGSRDATPAAATGS